MYDAIELTKRMLPVLLGAFSVGGLPLAMGQDAADGEEELFELSPFEVNASTDAGYRASETIAGTRFKTLLKDVPSQINIMTKEFLDDVAAIDVADAFLYSANIENTSEYTSVANGEFSGGVINIDASNRIRGISRPGRSRDFFTSKLPRDSYNIDRITVSSGPNAILFGNANPGGVVNTAFMRANTGNH